MTVHLFGAVSSPGCACYALRKSAEDNTDSFPAATTDTINRNFYMDDCLPSAVELVRDLMTVRKEASI